MAWNGEKELTEGQLRAAEYAGIPDNRPGLYAEYPKAVYKADTDTTDRTYLNEPLLVAGKYAVKSATVANEDEELQALEQGWSTSPDVEADKARRAEEAEIAEARAMIAEQKRGPGRPPRQAESEL